jgi:hypothetical protein
MFSRLHVLVFLCRGGRQVGRVVVNTRSSRPALAGRCPPSVLNACGVRTAGRRIYAPTDAQSGRNRNRHLKYRRFSNPSTRGIGEPRALLRGRYEMAGTAAAVPPADTREEDADQEDALRPPEGVHGVIRPAEDTTRHYMVILPSDFKSLNASDAAKSSAVLSKIHQASALRKRTLCATLSKNCAEYSE